MKVLGVLAALLLFSSGAHSAGPPIRIGELNSYNAQPSFLNPYRNGWKLAWEEINAAGGVLGRPIEVISRDDMGTPGDAVRVAQSLVSQDHAELIFGTFLSNVGLAVADFARQRKIVFLAAEPLTDRITWQDGNRYTFRLAPSTYMQVAMLVPEAAKLKRRRWVLVYPNYEYGQSAANTFKKLLRDLQPEVEFVAELKTDLGRLDGGAVAQAISFMKPDAIFNALFGTDLAKFVREGHLRGVFVDRSVVSLLSGWPEYLEPLREEAPEGWIVTAYPWYGIHTPAHDRFLNAYRARWGESPKLGSVIGYVALKSVAAAVTRAGSTDPERLIPAFAGLTVDTPFGAISYRGVDHQSTMGTYVGITALRDGRGVTRDYRYIDGATVMPSDAEVRARRPRD